MACSKATDKLPIENLLVRELLLLRSQASNIAHGKQLFHIQLCEALTYIHYVEQMQPCSTGSSF